MNSVYSGNIFLMALYHQCYRATSLSRFHDHTQTHHTRQDTKHSQEINFHATGGIRTRNPSKREDEDPRLRSRGHRNLVMIIIKKDRFSLLANSGDFQILTFKNRASYIQDGSTATLQKLHFIYIFSTNISTEYFSHAAQSPLFSSKCRLFHNAIIFGSCIIHILHTECAKI